MKYAQWLNEWLENYVRPTAKIKTYVRYSEIVCQHLNCRLGGFELSELTPVLLQRYTSELSVSGNVKTGKGLSSSSVNGIVTVIQSSLKTAYTAGHTAEYTADRIKRPKAAGKQVTCFSFDEQKIIEAKILDGKDIRMYGVIICLYTGLRVGELLALEWTDVDLKNGVLSVNKTCHDGIACDGKFSRITCAPKTRTSQRLIPLPKQIIPLLRKIKKNSRSQYVISSRKGAPTAVRVYQRNFEVILKQLNIPHRGFHSLRHTFATRALECGMDVKTLSELLGHKSPTVTLNRYVHSFMEHKQEMMNRLGKLL